MSDYIAKTTILSRDGWTEKALSLFAPLCDKEVPNSHSKKAAPMKLYLLSKIENIEASDDFKAFVLKNKKRREGAERAIDTKIKRLHEYVDNLIVNVPNLEKGDLLQAACEHFNNRKDYEYQMYQEWENRNYKESLIGESPDFSHATPESDPIFLKRICLNYLRHEMTDYENILTCMGGKPGKDDVYEKLKKKVNGAIVLQYEWLKTEE